LGNHNPILRDRLRFCFDESQAVGALAAQHPRGDSSNLERPTGTG